MEASITRQFDYLPPWTKHLAVIVVLAVLYIVTARLGLLLALPPEGKATAVWPPSGIALAGVLLFGYRVWPGIWLGAFLGNLWDFFEPTNQLSLASHLWVSSGIAGGSTLQPLLGAYLIRRFMGQQNPLASSGNTFRFVGVALLICLVAPTIGVIFVFSAGFATWSNLGFNWLTWWIGDLMGILVITPLLLTWRQLPDWPLKPRLWAEAGLLLMVLLGIGLLNFGDWNPWGINNRILNYMTIPPVVWAALRFGRHGATACLVLVLGMAVWGTAQFRGPWVMQTLNEAFILLQTFLGVLTLTTLALVAVLTERQRGEVALHERTERLHLAQQAGYIGVWDWNAITGQLVWDGVEPLLGLEPGSLGGSLEAFLEYVHPQDRGAVLKARVQSIDQGGEVDLEYRVVWPDGSIHWLSGKGQSFQNTEGQTVRASGTCQDITQRKESEERYKLVLAGAGVAIWDWDVPAKRVLYSPRWKELRGLSDNEVSDHEEQWSSGIHPDDFPGVMAAVQAHFEGQTPFFSEEYRVRHKDGHWVWILDRGVARRDSAGRVVRMAGSETDITERKQAQEQLMARVESQLKETMEMFYSLFEFAPDAILVVKENGVIIRVNSHAEQLFGYTREELIGRPVELLVPERFVDRHGGHRSQYLRDPHARPMGAGLELFGRRKDGSEFPVDIMLSPVDTHEGRLVLAVVRDVTERQQAEKELGFQGQIIRNIAEGVIVVRSGDRAIIYANPAFDEMFGYGAGELIGKPVSILNVPGEKSPEQVAKEIITVLEKEGVWRGEVHNVKKDGTPFWSYARASAFEHHEYQNAWISTQVDISERKAAEEALSESETRFRSLVESASAAIVIADENGSIVSWNPGAMNVFGYAQEEALGQSFTVLMPERYHEAHQRALERVSITGEGSLLGKTLEFQALRKDGTEFPIELSLFSWQTGTRRFFSGIIYDITERKVAEEQVREALKRELLLKEEVHHRVKNNLQVVKSLLYLESIGASDQATGEILRNCQNRIQAIALVHEKLYRSKDLERVDFADYAAELVLDLVSTYGVQRKDVSVHTDIENVALGVDTAVPCGLIMNELISNAFKHAFVNEAKGELWIKMRQTGDKTYSLIVRDNGIGLPEGFNLETARSLGMKLVRDLTRQLDGSLSVESGKGTTIRATFEEPTYRERW